MDDATLPRMPTPARGAGGAQAAAAARMKRGAKAKEKEDRTNFLNTFLNEDLQHLTRWHGTRPEHEQKRFLKGVDTMYKAFSSQGTAPGFAPPKQPSRAEVNVEAQAREAARQSAMESARQMQQEAADEDPLNGPPRLTPRGETPGRFASSASAPNLPTKPIDVFEQRKRDNTRRMNDAHAGDERDLNGLDHWLDAQSMSSMTTASTSASRFTTLTQKTMTSSGGPSVCSEPGTTNQMAYRHHKRGIHANRKGWDMGDQHSAGALKDGIPGFGFPDNERMHTQFRDAYGHMPIGEKMAPGMYKSVFQDDKHPFVARFLETANPEQRTQFSGMVRSLEYLRRKPIRETTTMMTEDMDLAENARLWRCPRQKAVFTTAQLNLSRVPLGTAGFVKGRKGKPETPAPPGTPPSPSVSGLGSLQLSRLSTPMVAGVDLPLACAPQEYFNIPPRLEPVPEFAATQ